MERIPPPQSEDAVKREDERSIGGKKDSSGALQLRGGW